MHKILLFTYAGIFLLISLPVLLIVWIIGLFSPPLRNKLAFGIAQQFSRSVLFFLGATMDVKGLEHIPHHGSILFVGNHKGLIDILLTLAYIPRPAGFIAKDSLAKIPGLSWWMLAFQCLFLDRNSSRKALTTILQGIENMKNGHSYIIFPEGTRNIGSHDLLAFKKGSLKLAEKSNSLIIPFALRGTDEMYEQNNYQVKKGRLWLHFGPAINLNSLTAQELKTSNEYVKAIVKDLYDASLTTDTDQEN